MKKQIIVEVDQVNGEVDLQNPDNLNYFEVCGALEYARMMVVKAWLDDHEPAD